MVVSKRTTARIGHLSSSTKIKQETKKIPPYDKVCCPTIHQIALRLLWLQLMEKLVAFVAEIEQ